MYINIKLPPAFNSFNRLRMENYPFNTLFTEFLDEVCRLGLSKKMAVGELVGWIEDRVFEGQRLPDIPETDGGSAVNIRYRIDDAKHPDIVKYITGSENTTNRMAVMYIARLTLRLSVSYGTSLFRLKRLIMELANEKPPKKQKTRTEECVPETPKPRVIRAEEPVEAPVETPEETLVETPVMPRVSAKTVQENTPTKTETSAVPAKEPPRSSGVMESANAAKAALGELADLAAVAEGMKEGEIVETNPYLGDFLKI